MGSVDADVIANLSFLQSDEADSTHPDLADSLLPVQTKKLTKRIIRLSADALGLQFSLVKQATQQPVLMSFDSLASLRLVPLRNAFAQSRMLRRLNVSDSVLKQRAEKRQQVFIDFLYTLYNRSFLSAADERYQLWIDYVEAEQVNCVQQIQVSQVYKKASYYFFCAPDYRAAHHVEVLLAQVLQENPQSVIVYSDEDSVDQYGTRMSPWFKPDWNPDLFLAQDYISACYACRYDWYEKHRDVFESLGPRFALSRLLPDLPADAIQHVPQILVHRSIDAGATVDDADYSSVSEREQRIEVLKDQLPASVRFEAGLLTESIRVRYPLPEPVPLVSLLIPTRDALDVLKPCIESILTKTLYPNYEVLILDNQSVQPETKRWLEHIAQDERVRILQYDKPFNYSAINNFGMSHAHGSVIGLINNDVEVISPDWLMEMVSHAMRPEIGCVGAKLYYSNDQVQHGGVILGLGDVAGHAHRLAGRDDDGYHGRLKLVQNYSAVTAACLLVRREIYESVGGLEEKHLTVAYNDVDFCIRVRAAGYRNLWTPYAELYHHESISRGEDDTPAKKARYDKEVAYMQHKWKAQLSDDPCYNPHLCRRREDFSLPDVLF